MNHHNKISQEKKSVLFPTSLEAVLHGEVSNRLAFFTKNSKLHREFMKDIHFKLLFSKADYCVCLVLKCF